MSLIPHTICNCCNRTIKKAVAVSHGKAWCPACYKREFLKASCPDCGRGIRVLKGEEPSLCKGCRVKGRTCGRCGKLLPHASLIVEDKAYCAPCSRHMKEPQPCQICGTLTIYLARDLKRGVTVMACPKCRRVNHTTCVGCGKYREPAGTTDKGEPLCKACFVNKDIFGMPDGTCRICMQQGRLNWGKICDSCYRKRYIRKRYEAFIPQLQQPWVIDIYKGYIDLLTRGNMLCNLERKIVNDVQFFKTVEREFRNVKDLTVLQITKVFGTGWQKRHGIICSHLIESKIVPPLDDNEHYEATCYVKQLKLLEKAKGKWFYSYMKAFHDYRQTVLQRYRDRGWKGKKIRCKQVSVLTAMKAARRFFDFLEGDITGPQQINSALLDKFLTMHPGYSAPIRPFINYLKDHERTFLKIANPKADKKISPKNELPYAQYTQLLDTWLHPEPGKARNAVLGLFGLLYAQQPFKLAKLKVADVTKDTDGTLMVTFAKAPIRLAAGVSNVLKQYLTERKTALRFNLSENPYLFPGRNVNASIGKDYIPQLMAAYGVSTKQLFSSAMQNIYRGGLQNPKVAKVAYGISGAVACKYFEIIDIRLKDEIRDRGKRKNAR